MRYLFIDDVVRLDLEGEARLEVRKTFPPGDDTLSGPGGEGRVPESMVLELMAMTGGRLLFERVAGTRMPLLLKVRDCAFEAPARPGVPLCAVARLEGLADVGAGATMAEAETEVRASGERIAGARLVFVCAPVPGPAR